MISRVRLTVLMYAKQNERDSVNRLITALQAGDWKSAKVLAVSFDCSAVRCSAYRRHLATPALWSIVRQIQSLAHRPRVRRL